MAIDPTPTDGYDPGTAGASARREYEKRKANRERRTLEKRPRLGRALLMVGEAPAHETAWARGASGEELVAKVLAKRLNDGVVVLHDRRVPGSRANIDHIAIAPTGVWVIDTKRYKGKVAVQRPLLGEAKLTIAGRDKSVLADGLAKQVALVEADVSDLGDDVKVRGVLCFVDADLPMLGTLSFRGFPLLYAKALAKRLNADGPLRANRLQDLAEALAERFPPA